MIDLLSSLNTPQQDVVKTTDGPLLVLAGAGSGKTRCIIHRTAYLLLEKKVKPWNILIVTFTNKAARELKDRLASQFGINLRQIWVGTFHSICRRILRFENAAIPFDQNFSIYDTDDKKTLLKKIFKDMEIDTKRFPVSFAQNAISKEKNNLIGPSKFWNFHDETKLPDKILFRVYTEYQKRLLRNNAMDFDDLLYHTAALFHNREDIRVKYENLFQYVMIDEYQDTNYAQFKIMYEICRYHKNICVVGDDDQAIYSWRGATIQNILNFEKDYANPQTVRLEQNYRSTPEILLAANDLIKKNSKRHEKELWTDNNKGDFPTLTISDTEQIEAKQIGKTIKKELKQDKLTYNHFAILYRTNAQSRIFEQEFLKQNIPYQIVGGVNFLQRKEIKDILAYLRTLMNFQDNESLIRIINFPSRKIGQVTIHKLLDFALDNNCSLWDAVANVEKISTIKGRTTANIKQFHFLMEKWSKFGKENPIPDLVKLIISDLDLVSMYENSKDIQQVTRAENTKEFMASASEFYENYLKENEQEPTLQDFLQSISLQTDLDAVKDSDDCVKLMTLHNAKGLEFHTVFLVGLSDGCLPHSMCLQTDHQLEEERRLFYVGITRAKQKLFFSYSRWRRTYDQVEQTIASRFLDDIQDDHINIDGGNLYEIKAQPQRSYSKLDAKPTVVLESEKHYKIGQKVNHGKFGNGTILSVNGTGIDAKLTISFANGSLKKIQGSFVTIGKK
jgi:DNA helicase-2/ATP-dependent DNA helicase PcrA